MLSRSYVLKVTCTSFSAKGTLIFHTFLPHVLGILCCPPPQPLFMQNKIPGVSVFKGVSDPYISPRNAHHDPSLCDMFSLMFTTFFVAWTKRNKVQVTFVNIYFLVQNCSSASHWMCKTFHTILWVLHSCTHKPAPPLCLPTCATLKCQVVKGQQVSSEQGFTTCCKGNHHCVLSLSEARFCPCSKLHSSLASSRGTQNCIYNPRGTKNSSIIPQSGEQCFFFCSRNVSAFFLRPSARIWWGFEPWAIARVAPVGQKNRLWNLILPISMYSWAPHDSLKVRNTGPEAPAAWTVVRVRYVSRASTGQSFWFEEGCRTTRNPLWFASFLMPWKYTMTQWDPHCLSRINPEQRPSHFKFVCLFCFVSFHLQERRI